MTNFFSLALNLDLSKKYNEIKLLKNRSFLQKINSTKYLIKTNLSETNFVTPIGS